jgi:methylmalonyl-CoA mutase
MNEKTKLLFSEFPPTDKQGWKDLVIKELNGGDFDKKMVWQTQDGIAVQPFYTKDDIENLDFIATAPQHFPFVRGNKTESNQWEICQSINASDIIVANAKAKDFISKGVTGIEFQLDFLSHQDDFDALLDGIDLQHTRIHFTGAHSYSILIELLKEFCKTKNIHTKEIKGSFHFDSFSYYLLKGEYYNSCEDNLNELECLLKETISHFPGFKAITINGHHFHNAGATIVQELAFSLSSAHEYLVSMLERDMLVQDILPLLRFSFATGSSYFPEIAKLRAARFLWSMITEKYAPDNKQLSQIEIHSISSSWNKTIFDSYNNILRSTTETMSAVIGGSESINTLPFDMTWKPSDQFSERIARNIQHILRDESYLDKVIDPSAGSYYIENLTASIAQHAWEMFLQIEAMGGYMKALESGFIKETIEKTAEDRYQKIASRKTNILGVNIYPNLNERMADKIQNPAPHANGNKGLKLFRGAQAFEEVRLATGNYIVNGGIRPKVYLAQYGKLAMRIARAQFITNFFGIAGYEIIDGPPINNIEWTVNQMIELNIDIVAICSSDDEYGDIAPDLVKAIKEADKEILVVVAGHPTEWIETLKTAGADDFIHIKTNALESLREYQGKLGISLI